jgi:hypothetical protein
VWNSKVLVTILPALAMHMHGSQEKDFWVAKGKQIESQMRNKSLCGMEEGLKGRCSHMGPSSTQEYSSFLVVEESEVGGQCFILERCCHWGIPLSLTAVGIVRMTR